MKNCILFVILPITVCPFCISFQFHSWRFYGHLHLQLNWVFEEYGKKSEENENKTAKNSKMIDFSRKISSVKIQNPGNNSSPQYFLFFVLILVQCMYEILYILVSLISSSTKYLANQQTLMSLTENTVSRSSWR